MERIGQFNAEVNGMCVLCNNAIETRNHLFFECDFSAGVLHSVMHRVGLSTLCRKFEDWLYILTTAQHPNCMVYKLRATAFSMSIYWVLRHRNMVRYSRVQSSRDHCVFQILRMLKIRWTRLSKARSRTTIELNRVLFL